jgi:hypothetical protein
MRQHAADVSAGSFAGKYQGATAADPSAYSSNQRDFAGQSVGHFRAFISGKRSIEQSFSSEVGMYTRST